MLRRHFLKTAGALSMPALTLAFRAAKAETLAVLATRWRNARARFLVLGAACDASIGDTDEAWDCLQEAAGVLKDADDALEAAILKASATTAVESEELLYAKAAARVGGSVFVVISGDIAGVVEVPASMLVGA